MKNINKQPFIALAFSWSAVGVAGCNAVAQEPVSCKDAIPRSKYEEALAAQKRAEQDRDDARNDVERERGRADGFAEALKARGNGLTDDLKQLKEKGMTVVISSLTGTKGNRGETSTNGTADSDGNPTGKKDPTPASNPVVVVSPVVVQPVVVAATQPANEKPDPGPCSYIQGSKDKNPSVECSGVKSSEIPGRRGILGK